MKRVLLLLVLLPAVIGCGMQQSLREAPQQNIYVALGASDAVGLGANNPLEESWPAQVLQGLPEGTQLVNLGISGSTLSEVLREELAPAIDAQPRWITLWPGINDLRRDVQLDRFKAQLDQLLSQLRSPTAGQAGPTVVILNIPDLRSLPAFAETDSTRLDAHVRSWNAAIAEAAERHGAVLVDLYANQLDLVQHPEYISADGFHPSTEGYQRIAELVLATLYHYDPTLTQ